MSAAGLIFLLGSVGFITGLCIWCFSRVLRSLGGRGGDR